MNGQKNIIYLLKVIGDKLNSSANRELRASGLTMTQANIICFLLEHDGHSTQKEIEASFDVSHPTVVNVIAQLEANGYIECKPAADDRRFKIIELTPMACDMIKDTANKLDSFEATLLSELSDEEQAAFRRGLELLYGKVKNVG